MALKHLAITLVLLISGFAPVLSQQRGKASFYSKRSTGARTSSGERLHHDSLTCAHRTYPFGTMLKVTNISNGKSVIVRVTDRGPFGRGRLVDLSYRAAKEIGMISQGVAMVRVERYFERRGVPFLDEEEDGLAELDLKEQKPQRQVYPEWLPKKQEKADSTKQTAKPIKANPQKTKIKRNTP